MPAPKANPTADLIQGYDTETQFAKKLGRTVRTVQRWRKQGIGPPFVLLGSIPYYPVEGQRDWLRNGGTRVATTNKSKQSKRVRK
jgi:hypothetical protein